MALFEKIEKARKVLGLFESASIPEVEKKYRELLRKWHPDKNMNDQEKANRMTTEIIESYEIVMEYFMNYKIPFTKEDVMKNSSIEDWWMNKFGSDPLWSDRKKKKS
jgi:preprotein translocase subunit Sec63